MENKEKFNKFVESVCPEIQEYVNFSHVQRKKNTFADVTLSRITNRSRYYRRILKTVNDSTRTKSIKQKYIHDMKVRKLLYRALSHI